MSFCKTLRQAIAPLLALLCLSAIEACGPSTAPSSQPNQDAILNHVVADPSIPFASAKLDTRQSLVDIYCDSMRYYYHGSDNNFHYFIDRLAYEVRYISRAIVNDDDLRSIFKIKISRDRAAIPHWQGSRPSREFLDWKRNTTLHRVDDIELDQDW